MRDEWSCHKSVMKVKVYNESFRAAGAWSELTVTVCRKTCLTDLRRSCGFISDRWSIQQCRNLMVLICRVSVSG
jgi:hypothetical protein